MRKDGTAKWTELSTMTKDNLIVEPVQQCVNVLHVGASVEVIRPVHLHFSDLGFEAFLLWDTDTRV